MPVDVALFAVLGAYLHDEGPPGLAKAACFVVLRGPSTGEPVTEVGLRSCSPEPLMLGVPFGSDRTGCGAPTVRNWRQPGSMCWSCVS